MTSQDGDYHIGRNSPGESASEAYGATVACPFIPERKIYENPHLYENGLRLADFCAVVVAAYLVNSSEIGQGRHLAPIQLGHIFFAAIVTVISYQLSGSYSLRWFRNLSAQLDAFAIGSLGALAAAMLIGLPGRVFSTPWLLATVATAAFLLLFNRLLVSKLVSVLDGYGLLQERVALVCAGDHARRIIRRVSYEPSAEMNLLGLFDDRLSRLPPHIGPCPVLGNTDDLLAYARNYRLDRVIVTLPWSAEARMLAILRKLRTIPVRIDLTPHNALWEFSAADVRRIAGIPVITVANARIRKQMGALKRLEDLVLSAILLVLLSPLLLAIALLVRLDSPGPVLFRQERFGFNNEIFKVYKFRTMKHAPEPDRTVRQAQRNDPRVTRLGRFLRRTSLDELPQLVNVLQGHMSIVGPRPHAVPHNIEYGNMIDEYFTRHNVKPGITGWSQVNGLRGETETEDKMRRRVQCDIYYIEHWSILFDMKIIVLTAFRVLLQNTAY